MKNLAKCAVGFGLVLSLVLMGATPSWSKAHDQGVADPPNTGGHTVGVSNAGGATADPGAGNPGGVSGGQNSEGDGQGTRGGSASGADGGNENSGGKGNSDPDPNK